MDARNTSDLIITLPNDKEFVLTRTLNAPRQLVFEAWTTPEHVRRWWGCDAMTMSICDIDLRVGGAWRYVLRTPTGEEHGFGGTYREIIRPERLVYTFIYDAYPDNAALNTVLFEDRDGRTQVTETVRHQTTEARDAHFQSGVEAGAREVYARLEDLLATMK
jgi:uncharacterized protein YndB with AHSA1/START domain